MKKIFSLAVPVIAYLSIISCNGSGGDAAKVADSTNTAKIDSTKTADTVASVASHLADLKTDAQFAVGAADGGLLEVALGRLAVEKGGSEAIRKLGAMMVKDHSKANKELMALAKLKNIAVPESMSDKCDIDDFKNEADKGMDKQLSNWAKTTLPVLEHHLAMADNAKKIVDKS